MFRPGPGPLRSTSATRGRRADLKEWDLVTERISRRNALTGAALLGVAVPTLAACGGDDKSEPMSTKNVPVGGGKVFPDNEVVVTQPTEGTFVGFKNKCTHQGCVMQDVTKTINCSCHGSRFSIEDGSNVRGPNKQPAGT